MHAINIIAKKRDGAELSREEIEFFIRRATLHFEMAANVKTELETYLTVVGGSKVKPAAIQKSLAMFD